jgi:predicted Zn-dependent peptidase
MSKPIHPGRKRNCACVLAVLLQSLTLSSLLAQKVPVVEKTLSNGMRVLLVRRENETTVSGGWVAHVGSSNERPGITGIAHLFEHMMFKGTPTIATDAKRDRDHRRAGASPRADAAGGP